MIFIGSKLKSVLKKVAAVFFQSGVLTKTTRNIIETRPAGYHKHTKERYSISRCFPAYRLLYLSTNFALGRSEGL